MKQLLLLILMTTSTLFLPTCAVLNYTKRAAASAAGFSIEKFENEKTGRFSAVFKMTKADCFAKILGIINNLKAKVMHKNFKSGYIIAFNFSDSFDCCLNSTELGIFITDIKNGNVKVEIISNNSMLAKKLSPKFFKMLACE